MTDAFHRSDKADYEAELRASGLRRLVLVLTCGGIAGVAAYIANLLEPSGYWREVSWILAGIAVAFVAAATVLRTGDLFAERIRLGGRVRRSETISRQFRQELESRYPDIAARAGEIDAATLTARLRLRPEDHADQRHWNRAG